MSSPAVIFLIVIYRNKKNSLNCDSSIGGTISCDNLKKLTSVGFGSKYQGNASNDLKVSSLTPNSSGILAIPGPLYFPNGITIYKDPAIPITPDPQPVNSTDNKYYQIDTFTTQLYAIIKDSQQTPQWPNKLYTLLQNVNPNPANINFFYDGIQHFINLLDAYLAHHDQNSDPVWEGYHSFFVYLSNLPVVVIDSKGAITTIDLSFNPPKSIPGPPGPIPNYNINNAWPSISTIINWLKQQISNIGGISGVIKKFETRIKYDMIQSLINNESVDGKSYRVLAPGTPKGTGECTTLPASWWQNCPEGSVPVGWQGYKDDSSHACHKWWQFGLGELMCQQLASVYTSRLGGKCDDLIKPDAKRDYDFAASIIARILSDLGLIPKLAGVIRVVQWIFSEGLGNFDWIFDDLVDVCSNYMCAQSVTGQEFACADSTGSTNCCPAASDAQVASRACPSSDPNNFCLAGPAGQCKKNAPCTPFNLTQLIQGKNNSVMDPPPIRDLYHISSVPRKK